MLKGFILSVLVTGLVACGSSSPAQPQSVFYNWIFKNGDTAIGLNLYPNNTYIAQTLRTTSASSAQDQIQTGAVTITPSTMTFQPWESSCAHVTPTQPVYTAGYSLSNGVLDLALSTGTIVFQLNMAPPSTNLLLSNGCFVQDGSFQPAPLAPVSN